MSPAEKTVAEQTAPINRVGACQFADITPNASGKIVQRGFWRCLFQVPEPVLPESVLQAWNFRWPPTKTSVDKEACSKCQCWTARKIDA